MSVIRMDKWLDKYFDDPEIILNELLSDTIDASDFYHYLLKFGMYVPNGITYKTYLQLKKEDTWKKVESIFLRYKQKWNGPDIPVYIFPIHHQKKASMNGKSGISFPDKMFLFLSPLEDEKELEALVIHEYHHVCRLKHLKKSSAEYTLLDSIVMEGLAEFAVLRCLGAKYRADWITYYSDEKLQFYWERYFEKNSHIKRKEKLHDALLFGKGMFPHLIGYAVGYWLIDKVVQKRTFSIKDSITLPTNKMINE